ncbi:MAG: alkylmercury lyase family protein [Chloroflexi bacterium]|nr:alkylmercury lyase family protein [Chloroflexota bacterium]MCI0578015.1 alkylmercury lyase family protein [Chloroflexota bacterium]MCI0646713.1 alkylmercury lyase family protein [Chloroflexota bacterium]MCI0726114.1 alkylmercury lyase family protein [Chloroflexota bacterium]
MLLFWSEEHVTRWRQDWRLPGGEVIPLDKCWRLAEAWYSPDRRRPEWRRRTAEEAQALLAGLGFSSPFWSLA